MLHDLSELYDAPLETRSGLAAMREIFFDRATGRIRLLAIETLHKPRTEALIDAASLSTPVRDTGGWTLAVDAEGISEALSWPEVMTDDADDLTIWPMVMTGPLGTSFAPLLALNALRAETSSETDGTSPDTRTANDLTAPLEQAREWIGAPVFGADGELGRLQALLFEPATRTIRTLRLTDTPKGGPVDLPFDSLRHRAGAGGHLVVEALRDDLERTPVPTA